MLDAWGQVEPSQVSGRIKADEVDYLAAGSALHRAVLCGMYGV